MNDYTSLRSDRRTRLLSEPDRIVAWQVRWQIGPQVFHQDHDFEIDATNLFNQFEDAGIECSLEPVWGWEIKTGSGKKATRAKAYKVAWTIGGEEVFGPLMDDRAEAEDAACQMRLAGLEARVVNTYRELTL